MASAGRSRAPLRRSTSVRQAQPVFGLNRVGIMVFAAATLAVVGGAFGLGYHFGHQAGADTPPRSFGQAEAHASSDASSSTDAVVEGVRESASGGVGRSGGLVSAASHAPPHAANGALSVAANDALSRAANDALSVAVSEAARDTVPVAVSDPAHDASSKTWPLPEVTKQSRGVRDGPGGVGIEGVEPEGSRGVWAGGPGQASRTHEGPDGGGARPVAAADGVPDDARQRTGFGLQIGAFESRTEAEAFLRRLPRLPDFAPFVQATPVPGRGTWYRVRAGEFPDAQAAERARAGLAEGLRDQAIVVRYR